MIVIDRQGTRIEVHGLADMASEEFLKHLEFARLFAGVARDDAPRQLPPPAPKAMVEKASPVAEPKPRGRKPPAAKNAPAKKARPDKSLGGGDSKRTRQKWDEERKASFATMWRGGASMASIGLKFGLNPNAVRTQAARLDLPTQREMAAARAAPSQAPADQPSPAGKTIAASTDNIVAFLRSRDIVVVRDQDSVETPRWRVNGKGLMTADEMLRFANMKRRQIGQPEFHYGI